MDPSQSVDGVIEALRSVFGILLLVAAVLATAIWLVRSRRIQPFGPIGRATRRIGDPLIAPVERRLARAGISHTAAPWWALLVFLVLGATLIGTLGFLRDVLVATAHAAASGPIGLLRLGVSATIAALQLAVIVRVITSWVGGTYSPVGRLAAQLTEWFLAPLRRLLPTMGMIDLSPLVAYFALSLVRAVVLASL